MKHAERDEPNVVIVERGGGGGGGGTLSFLVGAAVGAIAALLFAPYAGSETRRRLGARAREMRDRAEETFEDARRQIDEGLASARDVVERQADEVRDVIEAGRTAARETRRELRRRHGAGGAERAASSTPADAEDAEPSES